ncbi:hypothetical protein A2U01_0081500 [Trifolium medium]|uniref:Secreted protein n=1 Tax=Trifolium medium TaxID=97028 RepID=A0A392TJY0_9FABA|nr:hypothetical protein [Trifolium medium]
MLSSTMSFTFSILSSARAGALPFACSAQPNLQHSQLSSTMSSTFSILSSARTRVLPSA